MNTFEFTWTYNTQTAIESIADYIDGLTLVDENTVPRDGYLFTPEYIIWPPDPFGRNPIPIGYDDELKYSGYVEDLRPIKAQLGKPIDPFTGEIISGSIWNTDYEFHLEEGTKALLQPVVTLASGHLLPLLNTFADQINDLTRRLHTPVEIIVAKGESIFSSPVTYTYPDTWDTGTINNGPVFDHWPRIQFMESTQDGSGAIEINSFRLDILPGVTVLYSEETGHYTVHLPVDATRGTFGKLLIW